MKINKNAIKDAIEVLKEYKRFDEIFLTQSDKLLEGMEFGSKFLAPILDDKRKRIKKSETTIAQLSMMLYSK